MKLERQTWMCLGLGLAIILLTLFGIPAHESSVTAELVTEQHLVALRLKAERLSFKFTGLPDMFEGLAYGGKGMSHPYVSWHYTETQDWTVLNYGSLTGPCSTLFLQIAEYNSLKALDYVGMSVLATNHKSTPVTLWAYTPQFTQEPQAMASCAEQKMGFDAARGMLTYKGKPIAILADTSLGHSIEH